MREYLIGQLHGPMASWGETVAGEWRTTQTHPTRSALLGMLAAALGLAREAVEQQRELSHSLWLGVVVHQGGTVIEDFHTTQAPGGVGGRGLTTRAEELDYKKLNTILSRRSYVCDQTVSFGFWAKEGAQPGLMARLLEALRRPHWTLYLGRKSCPPGLPVGAMLVEAPTLHEALERAQVFVRLRGFRAAGRRRVGALGCASASWACPRWTVGGEGAHTAPR